MECLPAPAACRCAAYSTDNALSYVGKNDVGSKVPGERLGMRQCGIRPTAQCVAPRLIACLPESAPWASGMAPPAPAAAWLSW